MNWREVFEAARDRSPFYRELYRGLRSERAPEDLAELPVVDQAAFWRANSVRDNRLLTGPLRDGVVFKSGGTTGAPKFSYFSRAEWESFTRAFGRGMNRGGLRAGARVGNFFYAGSLYASFLFILKSVENAPEPAVNFPISGAAPFEDAFATMRDFEVDTMVGVPTTLEAFRAQLEARGERLPALKRVLFGGERMYPEARAAFARMFPGVEIRSIGYASVDAGLLGYADAGCGADEHRCFDGETVLEILDEETGAPVAEPGRVGRVVVTSLSRTLMPILRYPAGDRAAWVEPAGTRDRKFRLAGRSEEGARVGPVTLYYEDVQALVGAPFQMVIERLDGRDLLTLKIAGALEGVLDRLHAARPLLRDLADAGRIHAPRLESLAADRLETNARTGKLRRVIDRR